MTDMLNAILSASAGPVAIFTDFDGTLVDIAPTPDAVIVPADLPLRLENLSKSLDGAFAVVTGRTIAAIDGFLPGESFSLSGSHGAEQRHEGKVESPDPDFIKTARTLANRLDDALGNEKGILVEPKPTGVAVHYRAAPQKEGLAHAAMSAALEGVDAFHSVLGKKVVEARPHTANKGEAVATLMQIPPFAGRIPVFIGDDVTDEDGFAYVQAQGGFGIKVGLGETAARFRLADIEAVYRYFDALAAGGLPPAPNPRPLSLETMVK